MPGQLIMKERSASVSLRFVIVGGSLAGLSAGYALRKAGHQVVILERSDGTKRSRGGIRCPPNMTRILNNWGLRAPLEKVGVRFTEFDFFEGNSGHPLGRTVLHEQLLRDLRADFLFIQHGELQSIFVDACVRAGVYIRYSSCVTIVDPDAPSVTLDNGEIVSGDIIIGADGHNSTVRSVVIDEDMIIARPDRHLALIASIPTELLLEDDELRSLAQSHLWSIWLGDDVFVHGSFIRSKRVFSVNVFVPSKGKVSTEDWDSECQINELDIDFDKFEPRIQKLLKLARTAIPTYHVIREPFETFVSDQSTVCLVGEAAHPIMANSSHNASMCIEDAAVLGRLFSRIQHRDQVSCLIGAYEELRQPRCAATIEYEWRKRRFFTLPPGPEQIARDTGLREAMEKESNDWDGIDEEYLQWRYERELELFAYDAIEKVEDWWTKWGALLDRQTVFDNSHRPPVEVSVHHEMPGVYAMNGGIH